MASQKFSRQRQGIMNYLKSTTSHPTAEHVYMKIREEFPKICLGTVYRNLNLLADQGEILRLRCGDGVDHFDACTKPHNHFICRSCGSVLDLPMDSIDDIDQMAAANFKGRIYGHEVYFYGICPSCMDK